MNTSPHLTSPHLTSFKSFLKTEPGFKMRIFILLIMFVALWMPMGVEGAPSNPNGTPGEIRQPGGEKVRVRIFGDEFYRRYETLDGQTILRDSASGYWFYAVPDTDQSGVLMSLIRVGIDSAPVVPLHLKESGGEASKKHKEAYSRMIERTSIGQKRMEKKLQHMIQSGSDSSSIQKVLDVYNGKYTVDTRRRLEYNPVHKQLYIKGALSTFAAGHYNLPPKVKGMVLLVDFPDVPFTFPASEVNDLMNKVGYNNYGNSGSVHDYYNWQSGGKLDLSYEVTPVYLRMDSPRSYYDYHASGLGPYELIRDAVAKYNQLYPTATHDELTIDGSTNSVFALSLLYAGEFGENQLWPHMSSLSWGYSAQLANCEYPFYQYQMTALTSDLSIGTICHETGHLVCGFQDYYDYGGAWGASDNVQSYGVYQHCLMGAGNYNNDQKSPAQISAYLRHLMGWGECTEITKTMTSLTLNARSRGYCRLKNPNKNEYFLIENRYAANESVDPYQYHLPSKGVAIWHVDETVETWNEYQQRTEAQHYEYSLEQADGLFELEKSRSERINQSNDYYDNINGRNTFGPTTTPNSRWWNNTHSEFRVHSIPSPAETVTVGLTFAPCVENINAGTDVRAVKEPTRIVLYSPTPSVRIHYTTDGSTPTEASPRFYNSILIDTAMPVTEIRAIAYRDNYVPSDMARFVFWSQGITISSPKNNPIYRYYDPIPVSFTVPMDCQVRVDLMNSANSSSYHEYVDAKKGENSLSLPNYYTLASTLGWVMNNFHSGDHIRVSSVEFPEMYATSSKYEVGEQMTITPVYPTTPVLTMNVGDTCVCDFTSDYFLREELGGYARRYETDGNGVASFYNGTFYGELEARKAGETTITFRQPVNSWNYLYRKPNRPYRYDFLPGAYSFKLIVKDHVKKPQKIVVNQCPSVVEAESRAHKISVTSTSGLPVEYTWSPWGIFAVFEYDQIVYGYKPGDATLIITQPGNEEYLEAPEVRIPISVVSTTPQTITASVPSTLTVREVAQAVAEASSRLPVKFTSSAPSIVSINDDGVMTSMRPGTATITIIQPGSNAYAPASYTSTVRVQGTPTTSQTITLVSAPDEISTKNTTGRVVATASSGLSVTYASGNTTVLLVDATSGILTPVSKGSATISISQSGNDTYLPATTITKSINVFAYPEVVKQEPPHEDGISIQWAPSDKLFHVQRGESETGPFSTIRTDFSGGSFVDTTCIPGKTYYYRLIPQ